MHERDKDSFRAIALSFVLIVVWSFQVWVLTMVGLHIAPDISIEAGIGYVIGAIIFSFALSWKLLEQWITPILDRINEDEEIIRKYRKKRR